MIDMQKVRSLPNCKIDYAAANEMHKVTTQMLPDDDGNPDYGQIIGAYLGWALDEIDRLREALVEERAMKLMTEHNDASSPIKDMVDFLCEARQQLGRRGRYELHKPRTIQFHARPD